MDRANGLPRGVERLKSGHYRGRWTDDDGVRRVTPAVESPEDAERAIAKAKAAQDDPTTGRLFCLPCLRQREWVDAITVSHGEAVCRVHVVLLPQQ